MGGQQLDAKDGDKAMIRIGLYAPCLDGRAKDIIEDGHGHVSDWELLGRLVWMAKRDGLEMEFVRLEEGGAIVIDLETMEAALEMNVEVRPEGGKCPYCRGELAAA